MITGQLVTGKTWSSNRIPIKHQNAHWFDKFNKTLVKFVKNFDGNIVYNDFEASSNLALSHDTLQYQEGSPFFYFFKLSPAGYFINNYYPQNLWENYSIDDNILDFLISKDANKYKQPENIADIDYPFILFALQNNIIVENYYKTIEEVVLWAKETKTHVIFKKHPFSYKMDANDRYFLELEFRNKTSEFVKVVDQSVNTEFLIRKSKAVWTLNSAVGFSALLHQKPVSMLTNGKKIETDYASLAKICSTPEEAFDNQPQKIETLKRFFSWYYHTLILDLSHEKFEENLHNRLKLCFEDKKNVNELFGSMATPNNR